MSRVYGMDAKGFCGHYATDVAEGWYALEDQDSGHGVLISISVGGMSVHLALARIQGWRGDWVLIVEPYTSYPVSLADAVDRKTRCSIEAGQTFSIEIGASFYRAPETLADALARLK